jgi:hypothetical protein
VPDEASRLYRYFDNDLHRLIVKLAEEKISEVQEKAVTYFDVDVFDDSIAKATSKSAVYNHADLVVIGREQARKFSAHCGHMPMTSGSRRVLFSVTARRSRRVSRVP